MTVDRLQQAVAAEEHARTRVQATRDAFEAAKDQLRRCENETNGALMAANRRPQEVPPIQREAAE